MIIHYKMTKCFYLDSPFLCESVKSIILYHWNLGGEVACYPKNAKQFEGNLLIVDCMSQVCDGLIELLTLEGQSVFDPLCKQGNTTIGRMYYYSNFISYQS